MVKRHGGALLQSIASTVPRPARSAPSSPRLAKLSYQRIAQGRERLRLRAPWADDSGSPDDVIESFEQLASEGLIESRVGAGTFVSQAWAESDGRRRPAGVPRGRRPGPGRADDGAATSRFAAGCARAAGGHHDAGARAFPRRNGRAGGHALARLATDSLRLWRAQGYRPWQASPPHSPGQPRHRLASGWTDLSRGGAQQAFQLIASMLIDPGDRWVRETKKNKPPGRKKTKMSCLKKIIPPL